MESANNKSNKIKTTELPIYPCCRSKAVSNKKESSNIIEPYVSKTRKEIVSFLGPYFGESFERVSAILTTSKEYTYDLIKHVRNDQNQAARATFITSAAFIGYLLGRRGFFRRTLFAIIAAGSAVALCEPKMARDYVEVSFELTKRKTSEVYEYYDGPNLLRNINFPKFSNDGTNKKQ